MGLLIEVEEQVNIVKHLNTQEKIAVANDFVLLLILNNNIITMNKQISAIVKYLINKHYTPGHMDKKYLCLEIDEENRFNDGNTRIDAYGKWMKDFCVRTFFAEVWRNSRTDIFIHVGEQELNQYEIYKVIAGGDIKLELEEEPYIPNCEYYVSFVFQIHKRTLKNKFPVIKKYIKDVAKEHTALKVRITGSNEFWKVVDRAEQFSN